MVCESELSSPTSTRCIPLWIKPSSSYFDLLRHGRAKREQGGGDATTAGPRSGWHDATHAPGTTTIAGRRVGGTSRPAASNNCCSSDCCNLRALLRGLLDRPALWCVTFFLILAAHLLILIFLAGSEWGDCPSGSQYCPTRLEAVAALLGSTSKHGLALWAVTFGVTYLKSHQERAGEHAN